MITLCRIWALLPLWLSHAIGWGMGWLLMVCSTIYRRRFVDHARQAGLRPWQWLGAGLLLGGAIGNGLDRWRLGTVVDFLAFMPVRFPIFNGADVAINLAVLCFAFDLLPRHGSSPR